MLFFLHLFPLRFRQLLHIHHLVFLIDNLKAQHSFNDILQRDDATERSILVDDDRDMFFLFEQFLPNGGNIFVFGERQDRTCQFA